MKKRIVIIGGGFGGIHTLKSVSKYLKKEIKNKKIEIILIDKKNYFLFTPLLHEVISSSVRKEDVVHPLREICQNYNAKFIRGEVIEINLETQRIKLKNKYSLSYDYLVICSGSKAFYYNIKGAEEYSYTLKTLEDAENLRRNLIRLLEKTDIVNNENLQIIIIGGGPTGVEIAGEIKDFFNDIKDLYKNINFKKVNIYIIERCDKILQNFGDFISEKSTEYFKKRGIKILTNSSVKEITHNSVILENGKKIKSDITIFAVGIEPQLIKTFPSVKTKNKRIIVTKYLNIKEFNNVFVVGDVCYTDFPQTAQAATRMGEFVGKNIKNLIHKKPLEKFSYFHKGFIIPLSKGYAVGNIFGINFSGIFMWIIYRLIYLSKIPGFVNKINIAFDWFIGFFTKRETSEY